MSKAVRLRFIVLVAGPSMFSLCLLPGRATGTSGDDHSGSGYGSSDDHSGSSSDDHSGDDHGGGDASPDDFKGICSDDDHEWCSNSHDLDGNFDRLYGKSGVCIGSPSGNYLKYTSASAVEKYLPTNNGSCTALKSGTKTTNPSPGGSMFSCKVLALQLNVDFSTSGVRRYGYGSLILKGTGGSLDNRTVSYILSTCNSVLSGASPPTGYTITTLSALCDSLNTAFSNSVANQFALKHLATH